MGKDVLSLIILLVVIILMLTDKFPTTTLALTAAIVCCALGMYSFKDILSQIGSTTAVLIISLSVLGAAFFYSGLAHEIAAFVLKFTGKSEKGIIAGILIVSIVLSAFSSNTAVVLMMIPLVECISREADISLKRTMLPLAIGAGIGGGCTLIGGTSNVSGNQVLADAGLKQMGFWDIGIIGIPFAIVAVIFMLTLGTKTLPHADGGYDGPEVDDSIMKNESNKPRMILTGIILLLTFVAMMISTSALYVVGLIGSVVLILTKCVSEKEAFSMVDIKLLILIASFAVISSSISNTGGDKLIANTFVKVVGKGASPTVVCAALFIVTSFMTQFLSNVVAIMMMGPIAVTIAGALSVNPLAMVITVIIAGNACFASPFGSPYLTMLMPVAHYKFKDYVKTGLPLIIIELILSVIIIPLVWKF